MTDRIPPHTSEAEKSVISTCLHGYADDIVDILCVDDFYTTAHQKIYSVISGLNKRGTKVDMVSIVSVLRDKNQLDQCGGATYISNIYDWPMSIDIEAHCKIIKDKSTLRKIIETSQNAQNRALANEDADELLDSVQSNIFSIENTIDSKSCAKISETLTGCIETIEQRSRNKNHVIGIPTGITQLDFLTAGLQPGLIVLAARPRMGKSTLAMQFAYYAAKVLKVPSVVYSLEMMKNQLVMRLLSGESRIDYQRLRTGMVRKDEWDIITESSEKLSRLPIYIDDNTELSHMSLRRSIRNHVRKHGVRMAVIDHMHLMKISRDQRPDIEYGEISRSCKIISKEHNIPVILLCQLNRDCEKRTNKRPMLSDLRESGRIEQDADLIMFIYRDDVYDKSITNPNKGLAEIIVAKQRDGPEGMIKTAFLGNILRFENLSK